MNLSVGPIFTNFGPFTLDKTDLVGAFTFSNAIFGSFAPPSAFITTAGVRSDERQD